LQKIPIIDDSEKELIKEIFRRSAWIGDIARIYQVYEDVIADIIGLPKNKKERWKIFQDTCFYDHGHGDKTLEIRMNDYGIFLEDGDFEKFMPCCRMSHWNPLFWIRKFQAKMIPKSNDPIKKLRRNWILNKFPKFKGKEWTKLEFERREVMKLPGVRDQFPKMIL
jgi:hypothetical protein